MKKKIERTHRRIEQLADFLIQARHIHLNAREELGPLRLARRTRSIEIEVGDLGFGVGTCLGGGDEGDADPGEDCRLRRRGGREGEEGAEFGYEACFRGIMWVSDARCVECVR